MGLASIVTYLKKYCGSYSIKIIDSNWDDNILKTLKEYRPDIIGISSMTINYQKAIELAQEIKESLAGPIIIGGVHISTLPSSLSPTFDLGVLGEGEETLLELLKLYEKEGTFSKEKLKNIQGLVFWDEDKLILTDKREPMQPLDKIPPLDRSFLNKGYFDSRWIPWDGSKGVEGSIITSRGCPYRCVFCSTSRFWGKVRLNSPEFILKDVKNLIDNYYVSHIQIWDDLFAFNKKRLREIAGLFKSEGITCKVAFSCQVRSNLMDDELCRIMKEINIRTISLGFESGSDKILNYLKAGSVTVADNKRTIILAQKYDFRVWGSFIFGSPGETIEDMKETLGFIDFLLKGNCKANMWHFVMTPFPATPLWEIAKSRGKVSDHMNWNQLGHTNVDAPLLLDSSVNREEFKEVFMEANKKLAKLHIRDLSLAQIVKRPMNLLKTIFKDPKNALNLVYVYLRYKCSKSLGP